MGVYSSSSDWVHGQNRLWRELAGSTITRWIGLDDNVGDEDDPKFLGPGSAFRALSTMRVERTVGTALDLFIYQNDTTFGLAIKSNAEPQRRAVEWERDADLGELPIGRVERLHAHIDDREHSEQDLIEIELTVAGRRLLIAAAEVFPTWSGTPHYGWGEEELFVFTDPDVADEIMWMSPRRYTTQLIGSGPDGGDVFA